MRREGGAAVRPTVGCLRGTVLLYFTVEVGGDLRRVLWRGQLPPPPPPDQKRRERGRNTRVLAEPPPLHPLLMERGRGVRLRASMQRGPTRGPARARDYMRRFRFGLIVAPRGAADGRE